MTVLPILLPISGNFLGPKTSAATPAITTSSGTPSPNKHVQDRPGFVLGRVVGRPRTRALVCRVKNEVGLKKDEFVEEIRRDCEMGGLEIGDIAEESVISIISGCVPAIKLMLGDFLSMDEIDYLFLFLIFSDFSILNHSISAFFSSLLF